MYVDTVCVNACEFGLRICMRLCMCVLHHMCEGLYVCVRCLYMILRIGYGDVYVWDYACLYVCVYVCVCVCVCVCELIM